MNSLLHKLQTFVKSPKTLWLKLLLWTAPLWPEKLYLKLLFRYYMGTWLDWEHPRTYNEKIQWLKVYDHNPLYTMLVDKVRVKDHIARLIGKEYAAKLLGVWDSADDIDWDSLPDKFVLKTTAGGGGRVVVCKDKRTLDRDKAKASMRRSLKQNLYRAFREWPYKDVKHRVFAEELLEEANGEADLTDYKVMCFHGEPKLIQVHRGRYTHHTMDFYDTAWHKMPIRQATPNSDTTMDKLPLLDRMLELSAKLSKDIPTVRVDWYIVNGRLYFGEFTFYDASGFYPFATAEYDKIIGDWMDLSKVRIRR